MGQGALRPIDAAVCPSFPAGPDTCVPKRSVGLVVVGSASHRNPLRAPTRGFRFSLPQLPQKSTTHITGHQSDPEPPFDRQAIKRLPDQE